MSLYSIYSLFNCVLLCKVHLHGRQLSFQSTLHDSMESLPQGRKSKELFVKRR